jgi:membrane-associated phospholipid phosphatase
MRNTLTKRFYTRFYQKYTTMSEQKLDDRIEAYHKYTLSEYIVILSILLIWSVIGIAWLYLGKNEAFFIPEPYIIYQIFKAISFLGSELWFVIFFSFIYFAFEKRFSRRLIIPYLIGYHLTIVTKDIFRDPRPPSNEFFGEPLETSYGLPSGHTQSSVGVYGFIFHQFKSYPKKGRIIVRIFSFLLLVLVPISRIIIGAHDLQDILIGYLLGYSVLLIYFALEEWILSLKTKLPMVVKILLGAIASIVVWVSCIFIFPDNKYDFGLTCGLLLGVSIAFPLEEKYVRYNPIKMKTWQRLVYGITGTVITIGLYFGFSYLFGLTPSDYDYIFRFVKYFILSIIVTLLVPYIFTKITKQKE